MMLTACRWWGAPLMRPPQPSPGRALQNVMLAELEDLLRRGVARPVACECLAWLRPPHIEPEPTKAVVGLLLIRTSPGLSSTPLRTWFQWQHPQWCWSNEPLPDELPVLASDVP